MNEANWPIRVGGIYAPLRSTAEHFRGCRVTAIDGDRIHSILRTEISTGISEHDPQNDHAALFRKLYCPEDQSPIPALVDALRKIQLDLENIPGSPRTDYEAQALETAREALAYAAECGYPSKISGPSQAGKQSVLDALDYALTQQRKAS